MIPLRLYLIAGGAVLLLALLGGFVWRIRHDEAQKWKAKVDAAQAQVQVEQATTQALDHYTHATVVIREKSNAAVSQVQSAPGAQTPIDPERRAVLCAALASVRDGPVCEADDHDPAEPSQAVRGADVPDANPSR